MANVQTRAVISDRNLVFTLKVFIMENVLECARHKTALLVLFLLPKGHVPIHAAVDDRALVVLAWGHISQRVYELIIQIL